MFEKASRLKLRFNTTKGSIGIEDLWDLPLTSRSKVNLDDIAKGLSRELKQCEEESFVVQQSSANEILCLKFDLVKHIIGVRLEEAKAKESQAVNQAKKDKLSRLIEQKGDEALAGKSIEELIEMRDKL